MTIPFGKLEITASKDLNTGVMKAYVEIKLDPENETAFIEALSEVLIHDEQLRKIYNKAAKRASEKRASENN